MARPPEPAEVVAKLRGVAMFSELDDAALRQIAGSCEQVALPAGHAARRSLRVARALQVDLERNGERERAPALDVSASGFAAWVATPLEPGDEVTATVALPSGKPVQGQARVVRVEPHEARNRSSVGFQFLGLTAGDWERLETFVFDAVLEHIK